MKIKMLVMDVDGTLTDGHTWILGLPVITTICPAVKEGVDSRSAKTVTNDLQGVCDGLREALEHQELREAYLADVLWERRLKDILSLLEDAQ